MSEAPFRAQLAQTQSDVEKFLLRMPNWHLAAQVVPQLAALEEWTRHGRRPTRAERNRVNLGLLAVREIEPTDDLDLYRIAQGFHELQYGLTKMPMHVPRWLRIVGIR